MKVLIHTDSRGYLVPSKNINLTWPVMLKQKYPHNDYFINPNCYGGQSLYNLIKLADEIKPDLIFSQMLLLEMMTETYVQLFYLLKDLPIKFQKELNIIKIDTKNGDILELFECKNLINKEICNYSGSEYCFTFDKFDFVKEGLLYLNKYKHYSILPTFNYRNYYYDCLILNIQTYLNNYCNNSIHLSNILKKYDGDHYDESGHLAILNKICEKINL